MNDMTELENTDDESFSELMKRSIAEIPGLCPEWTDMNAHDPGITFLEMLMWLTEMQRYYLSQITEEHLGSYLRLLGTTVRPASPTIILARFSAEETVPIKKGTVFNIGDIPFRAAEDMVIVPDKPDIAVGKNSEIYIRQNFMPFKGKTLPLYFSSEEKNVNPMRDGFYPRAGIRARLISPDTEAECPVKDNTYGLYQNGFINITLPEAFDESAVLRLDFVSDDGFNLKQDISLDTDIRPLVQRDKDENTMGADGRVKENVVFTAEISGQKISAEVYGELLAGANAETPRDAFKRFKSEQRRIPRAVVAEDYERLAMKTPGLRAELVNVFSKEPGKVSVCVKTADGGLRKNEIKNLRKVLFEAKPIGTEIEILTPIIISAKLFISAKTDGWAGGRRLREHIEGVFKPVENTMGALIVMPELIKEISAFPAASEIKRVLLHLGRGVELSEGDELKLPEDCLLELSEIIIQ